MRQDNGPKITRQQPGGQPGSNLIPDGCQCHFRMTTNAPKPTLEDGDQMNLRGLEGEGRRTEWSFSQNALS